MSLRATLTRLIRARALRRSLVDAVLLLTACGLLAVAMSGVLAAGADAVWGDRFVAGDPPGQGDAVARCAEYREYAPAAGTCRDAAASHHTDEVVWDRVTVGVLGGAALAAWAWRRRRPGRAVLPAVLVPSVGATAFGIAALATAAFGLDRLAVDGTGAGAGQWLSAAVAAAVGSLAFGLRWLAALDEWVAVSGQ